MSSDEQPVDRPKPLTVTVRPRVARQLRLYATRTVRTPAEVVNEALVRFLTESGYWPPPDGSDWHASFG
jgi:hypothetical protein